MFFEYFELRDESWQQKNTPNSFLSTDKKAIFFVFIFIKLNATKDCLLKTIILSISRIFVKKNFLQHC